MQETTSERPAFVNVRAGLADEDDVVVTWTFGDGDDHEHAEVAMDEGEAMDLALALMGALGVTGFDVVQPGVAAIRYQRAGVWSEYHRD